MPFLVLSVLLLFAAYPLIGSPVATCILASSQLVLLISEIRKRQVAGVGAFIFMSFLFFGIRPLHLMIQNDKDLFTQIFLIRIDNVALGDAMWWASAAMLCFAAGAAIGSRFNRLTFLRRKTKATQDASVPVPSQGMCARLLMLQLLTVPIMLFLSNFGRGLYGSSFGAYAYDLPVPLQAIHVFTLSVLADRFRRGRSQSSLVLLGVSGAIFLFFTWLMRDVSLFRTFYLTGLMIAGIAVLQQLRHRVGYQWVILPIVLLQPFFEFLGQGRTAKNEDLAVEAFVDQVFERQTLGESYWNFYNAKGDMNIFDTFVAAKECTPRFYPYAWSWAYVPLHFVPRAWWTGKPRKGITQDVSFMHGAPYAPGIAGFFLLDGGLVWMLGSMAVLGYLLSVLDGYVQTMKNGYLKSCFTAIFTVNAMYLSRFFLWQYFYQVLYALIPCIILTWLLTRRGQQARIQPTALAHATDGMQRSNGVVH